MGRIFKGDEDLHYQDGSHRWVAPPDIEQEIWEANLRVHMERHRAGEPELPRPSPRNATTPRTTTGWLPRSTT